jgi:hypothetical protein
VFVITELRVSTRSGHLQALKFYRSYCTLLMQLTAFCQCRHVLHPEVHRCIFWNLVSGCGLEVSRRSVSERYASLCWHCVMWNPDARFYFNRHFVLMSRCRASVCQCRVLRRAVGSSSLDSVYGVSMIGVGTLGVALPGSFRKA